MYALQQIPLKDHMHLMLLFNDCYCEDIQAEKSFNTSNVTIQSTIIIHFYITYTTYIPYFKPFINILPAN